MLNAVLALIALQLAGEFLVELAGFPVPGMVVGLLLLLCLLALRGRLLGAERAIPAGLDGVAKALHGHLGLLFVPAGAGILAQAVPLAADGVAILVAVLLSTVATIAVTARLASGRSASLRLPEVPAAPVPEPQL